MISIKTKASVVHFNSVIYQELETYLQTKNPSMIFVLVDMNTHEDCLPQFLSHMNSGDIPVEVMEMPDGEEHKTIDICMGVWEAMSEYGADRQSLLINLGGGVVTDLGGFVASTYMRGINYINVPTSLLAMVDASVGGKTGVDLGVLKNQVGVISEGDMVLIDTSFLSTLPQNQMVSGYAEMLKHGLIRDRSYFERLSDLSQLTLDDLDQLIYESVVIKNNVVSEDPSEKGLRKILNFGHTLGHAIESYCLESDMRDTLLHGEAIAIGMMLETYLSSELLDFSKADLELISSTFLKTYSGVNFNEKEIDYIIDLLKHDKKNSHGKVKFVLLEAIGKPKLDCEVENTLIHKAFNYYQSLF
ncbi:3-dehydroquinate synthase [Winogradskyella maritima]|uniref:3-dehydroquinate synthase n=1 Tax=Winogradskyella maritima TaxID=1517766 RepID=A0ABV8AJP6_9FLAO|nr:3-dehydroquinate synthase [Winogradskyella maritima]